MTLFLKDAVIKPVATNGLEQLTGWYMDLLDYPEPIEQPSMGFGDDCGPVDDAPTPNHLAWMLTQIPYLPYPKACRWLGFIQGVLTCRGFADVEAQRNMTREVLQKLDSQ